MKKIAFICAGAFIVQCLQGYPSDTVTLRKCYDSARSHYPVFRTNEIIKRSLDIKLKNLAAIWYPQVGLSGQAVYYSDITEISLQSPVPIGDLPKAPHDQYRLAIDVNQTIWDGGFSVQQKAAERISASIDQKQLEMEMQQLREKINKVYFSILLLQENERLLKTSIETLTARLKSMESAVKHGIINPMQRDILQVEILKTEQGLASVQKDREAALAVLSELTGLNLSVPVTLLVPSIPAINDSLKLQRPELEMMDLQLSLNQQIRKVIQSRNRPKIFAFGQAGYGNPPGLNMLRNEWDTYWSIGAGLKWNLWDWGTARRESHLADLQAEKVSVQKETFELVLRTALEQEEANIGKYEEAVRRDEQIVSLRREILKGVSNQLDNGVITSTDFVAEHNALLQAEITMTTDRLLLLQSCLNYYILKGDIEEMIR